MEESVHCNRALLLAGGLVGAVWMSGGGAQAGGAEEGCPPGCVRFVALEPL